MHTDLSKLSVEFEAGTFENIIIHANFILKLLVKIHEEDGDHSRGVAVMLLNNKSIDITALQTIVGSGTVLPEKLQSWVTNANEKASRLLKNPKDDSSWQTRDPDNKKYGGGVQTSHHIISLSGLTEHGEEAFCLMIAVFMNWIDLEKAHEIANYSHNKMLKRLLQKICIGE